MCYFSGQEWTWERWPWRVIPHSPKIQNYWSLTIRLFSVITRTLLEWVLPLCRGAVGVIYSPSRPGSIVSQKMGFVTNSKTHSQAFFFCVRSLNVCLGTVKPVRWLSYLLLPIKPWGHSSWCSDSHDGLWRNLKWVRTPVVQ